MDYRDDEWIKAYLDVLPSHPGILAQIKAEWGDKSLAAFNRWRHSGLLSDLEFMEFCDSVIEVIAGRCG